MSSQNIPERFELFVLPPGTKKITVTPDTKLHNMLTVEVQKEDHTLGNLLTRQLQAHPSVLFAGYRMPHPLEHMFVMKVQTKSSDEVVGFSSGTGIGGAEISPVMAIQQSVDQLVHQLSTMDERLRAEVRRFKQAALAQHRRI